MNALSRTKRLCISLIIGLGLGLPMAAQAALIQDIYLKVVVGGEEGTPGTPITTHIGTMEFTTEVGNSLANVVAADIMLGGVAFTLTDMVSAFWAIDDTTWALTAFGFVWSSPTFGPLTAGYEFTISPDDFNPSGITGSLTSNGRGCDMDPSCLNESIAVSADLASMIRQDIPAFVPNEGTVPVPATALLFGLGLAGLGWSRRKKV